MFHRLVSLLGFAVLALGFISCESSDSEISEHPSKPEGIIQAKIDDDGRARIALVVAPKREGQVERDLSRFDGIDFLERNSQLDAADVSARAPDNRFPKTPATFRLV